MIRNGNLLLKLPPGVTISHQVEEDEVISIFDPEGNVVIPEYVEVGLCYEKKNEKYKTTLSIRSEPSLISTNMYVLLSKYDLLYAIDTNRNKIDGVDYCVSCRMLIRMEQKNEKEWSMELNRLPSFIFTNPSEHEEQIGWHQFIEQEGLGKRESKIGIVTDHDLGNMPLYNLREKEILKCGCLPNNIDFIYASAERDLISPLNKAIKQCDSDFKFLINQIKTGKMNCMGLNESDSPYYQKSGYLVPKS